MREGRDMHDLQVSQGQESLMQAHLQALMQTHLQALMQAHLQAKQQAVQVFRQAFEEAFNLPVEQQHEAFRQVHWVWQQAQERFDYAYRQALERAGQVIWP